MLAQRRRRWANIKATLGQCIGCTWLPQRLGPIIINWLSQGSVKSVLSSLIGCRLDHVSEQTFDFSRLVKTSNDRVRIYFFLKKKYTYQMKYSTKCGIRLVSIIKYLCGELHCALLYIALWHIALCFLVRCIALCGTLHFALWYMHCTLWHIALCFVVHCIVRWCILHCGLWYIALRVVIHCTVPCGKLHCACNVLCGTLHFALWYIALCSVVYCIIDGDTHHHAIRQRVLCHHCWKSHHVRPYMR